LIFKFKDMKIFIQTVNVLNGVHQSGMIDEPVKKGTEIANALSHFGLRYGDVTWETTKDNYRVGTVDNAQRIVSVITL